MAIMDVMAIRAVMPLSIIATIVPYLYILDGGGAHRALEHREVIPKSQIRKF